MNNNKMTAEEIQLLREHAENERQIHAKIMQDIDALTGKSLGEGKIPSIPISCVRQLEIVNHHRDDEVLALLQAYEGKSEEDSTNNLCDEAKQAIYDAADVLSHAKEYMLLYLPLPYAVEQRIYLDNKPIYYMEGETTREYYPAFSVEGELYMIKDTLKKCTQVTSKLVGELYFLRGYTKSHELSPEGQCVLMSFLTVQTGRDSVLDMLERFVFDYLCQYPELDATAERALIRTGCHKVILYYITHSETLMADEEAVNLLLERADREEVTAYMKRYSLE